MDEQKDYYPNRTAKIGDFCLGFFGLCLLAVIIIPIGLSSPGAARWWGGVLTVFLVAALGGVVYCFRKGRRYIAIGMISVIVVPALLVGTCAVFILGAGR